MSRLIDNLYTSKYFLELQNTTTTCVAVFPGCYLNKCVCMAIGAVVVGARGRLETANQSEQQQVTANLILVLRA